MDNIKPRRSSRRIRGLAPQIDPPPPPRAVYLPHELKVAVLAQLYKRDLKSVRLVSKEWNALATRPLFDRVYISCRAEDIEVFKNITSHPIISTGVRELVADVQINRFVQDCKEKTIGYSKLYKTHKKDTFLVKGYRKYRDHSAFEYRYMKSDLLFDDLYSGLRSLKHIRSVVLNTKIWHHDLHENKYYGTANPNPLLGPSSGSPLCRSWNPFHLRPLGWEMLPDVDYGRSQICAQFHILTRAISATNQNITSLLVEKDGVGGGLPQQALMKSNLTDCEFRHFMTAYSGLTCLEINITTNNTDQRDALTVLPELLWWTFGLRRLSLRLSKNVDRSLLPAGVSEYYRYDEIFPPLGIWRKLTELSISGLAIGGWDLMKLILGRERLKQLKLCEIDLLDGTWEGAIEGIRHLPRLTELSMYGPLKHCGGAVFRPHSPESELTDWKFLQDVESHFLCGGRHPCLTLESDPDTPLWWYFDLIPEKELDVMKLCAREDGLDIDDLFGSRK